MATSLAPHVDCCSKPVLDAHNSLVDTSHDTETVARCSACGTYWLTAWHEFMTFGSEGDLNWSWFARLDDEEAKKLLTVTGPPDHGFLRERRVLMVHHSDGDRLQVLVGPPRWVL